MLEIIETIYSIYILLLVTYCYDTITKNDDDFTPNVD